MERYGMCRFCGQTVIVEADEGASQDNLDALASYYCSCLAAVKFRQQQERKDAAFEYIDESFAGRESIAELLKRGAEVVFKDEVDGITIKQGEFTYRIKKDKDGYLQISSEYKKINTEEF